MRGAAGAERDQVGEHADEFVEFGQRPAEHGGADQEVAGAGHPVQQFVEDGQQHHERRCPLLPGQCVHFGGELRVALRQVVGAPEGRYRRAGYVGGQIQPLPQPGQRPPPVRQGGGEVVVGGPSTLPGGVVEEPYGGRCGAGDHQLHHQHQPAGVRDQVVGADGEVVTVATGDHGGPVERPLGQVEGGGRDLTGHPGHRGAVRLAGQSLRERVAQRARAGRTDPLTRFTVVESEGDPQRVLPGQHRVEGCRDVPKPCPGREFDDDTVVEQRYLGSQLTHRPHLPLCRRERDRSVAAVRRHDPVPDPGHLAVPHALQQLLFGVGQRRGARRWRGGRCGHLAYPSLRVTGSARARVGEHPLGVRVAHRLQPRHQGFLHHPGERLNGRLLEQRRQRHLHLEHPTDAGAELYGHQ